jgi:hypothetical protein
MHRCARCRRQEFQPRAIVFHFSRRVRCPRCGTDKVNTARRRDHVDKLYKNPLSLVQLLLGGRLYHCYYCRLQFYDLRKPAETARGMQGGSTAL